MFQRGCSLTIATCQSHATPADREQCPDKSLCVKKVEEMVSSRNNKEATSSDIVCC